MIIPLGKTAGPMKKAPSHGDEKGLRAIGRCDADSSKLRPHLSRHCPVGFGGKELAPGIRLGVKLRRAGCCGFKGPFPPPLWIKTLLCSVFVDLYYRE
jgi:hypothetical protein